MKIRPLLFTIILFVLPFGLSAQNYRLLEGKVSHPRLAVEGIHVINASRGNAEITDVNGEFEISIAVGERLLFSGVQFKQRELLITADIFSLAEVTVYLEEFVNELNEVVVSATFSTTDPNTGMSIMQSIQANAFLALQMQLQLQTQMRP